MSHFEKTRLWQTTLAAREDDDPHANERARLRSAYLEFANRAGDLAGEIHRDLPEFSRHDKEHLDALWRLADLIAGSNLEMTPAEGFVFGGAVLVHDLGLGLAAYPEGVRTLQAEPRWSDAIAAVLRTRLGRVASAEEIQTAGERDRRAATAQLLRELHAKHAQTLALIAWEHPTHGQLHLLEDPELRAAFGRVIGEIAQSHWIATGELVRRFHAELTAPAFLPNDWQVGALKLACLLRVADATHLDAARAPAFLRAVRRPQGFSENHWSFQEKLHQPRVHNERFEYTSGASFTPGDAHAWWLCLDLLRLADRELREVDALLADLGAQRFAVRGVAGVDAPDRLARLIRTDGWLPIDATIQVSDVTRLVKFLAGEELYGRNRRAALRELLQNATDAIRARRVLEKLDRDWGLATVRIGDDDRGEWLEIEDNGIGMSPSVLSTTLLDFGNSLWESGDLSRELPGLAGTGFESIGRFGIGFFSVFMLGDRVRVVSRRYETAREDTFALEFQNGVGERPLLRRADPEEYLVEGGTTVRVWLERGSHEENGLLWHGEGTSLSLAELCAATAPASEVSLAVEESGQRTLAVTANDWLDMDGAALLRRISKFWWEEIDDRTAELLGSHLSLMKEPDGRIAGRACLAPSSVGRDRAQGVVTVGGLQATMTSVVVGALVGEVRTTARDLAIPVVSTQTLQAWAGEQTAWLLEQDSTALDLAEAVCRFGGDPGDLPLCDSADGLLSLAQTIEWLRSKDEVALADVFDVRHGLGRGKDVTIRPGVLIYASSHLAVLISSGFQSWPESSLPPLLEHGDLRLRERGLITALCTGWDLTLEELAALPHTVGSRDVADLGDIAVPGDYVYTVRRGKAG